MVGIGYDSHRFAAGRRLVLGGVEIDHPQGLAGHSGPDTRDRVAAVLQDLGHVPDLLGLGQPVRGQLGGLVGVQRPLVVGAGARVELPAGQLRVQLLEIEERAPERHAR